MKRVLSFPDVNDRIEWIGTPEQQLAMLEEYSLDGFEIIWCDQNVQERFPSGKVPGMHLPFYADWMSFWLEDRDWLDYEFGGRAVWQEFFQGDNREAMIRYLGSSLEYADAQHVEYVVFHVSQVSVDEAFDYQFHYDDLSVINETIKLINMLLDPQGPGRTAATRGRPYRFQFLMENLWWSGLNMRDASLTRHLFDSVNYEHKGFVLDFGHLLNANTSIRTTDDAVRWIHHVLDEHEDLLPFIKAVHLHQSLTGAFVEASCARYREELPPTSLDRLNGREQDYYDRYRVSYEQVARIDQHAVWEMPGLNPILQRINPDYLVYEFRSATKDDLFSNLKRQNRYFGL